jgi:hypothetical protein
MHGKSGWQTVKSEAWKQPRQISEGTMPDELLRQRRATSSANRRIARPRGFLDQNPDVPAPWAADLFVFPPEANDAEMFAEIDTIAGLISSTASDADSPSGHYSAVRSFGPVQYRAVAIPHRARKKGGE